MPNPGTDGTERHFATQGLRFAQLEATPATATAAAGAATLNAGAGVITSETLTTAAAAVYTLTVTNNMVAATDLVLANVYNGSNTTGTPTIATVLPGAGIFTAVVQNIHASVAFNGTIKVQFLTIKALAL